MIDQCLIEKNVQWVGDSFRQRHRVCDELSTLKNVLEPQALYKLYAYILNESEKPWQMETAPDYGLWDVPRRKISWHAESIIEELHEVFSASTDLIADAVQRAVKFHGIVLWEDTQGYQIGWHSDNEILAATMQIYVAGPEINPGTEFDIGNGASHVCEFDINTGYFIDQTQSRLKHRTTGAVPAAANRYSLFAMWT